MKRVVLVADRGTVLEKLTAAVGAVRGAYIVRHVSGTAPMDQLLLSLAPDVVVIGDLERPGDTVARLAESRRAAPSAAVVISGSADRLPSALLASASSVLRAPVEPPQLAVVLRELIASPTVLQTLPTREGTPVQAAA